MNARCTAGPGRHLQSTGRLVVGLIAGSAGIAAAALTTTARADENAAGAAEVVEAADAAALRVSSEPNRAVALEVSAQTFVRDDDAGPPVTLVGVVHIGDRAYYREVQELLGGFDLVLYESVKPAGTGGTMPMAPDVTDAERIERTRASLGFIASVAELHRQRRSGYPADLEALRGFANDEEPRLADFLDSALLDAWGRAIVYTAEMIPPVETVLPPPTRFRLRSLGADDHDGGDDITLESTAAVAPLARAKEDNIQAQLAAALKLSFQLDAIDYDQERWRCSDMSIDQIQRAMSERGADFTLVEGTLAGTSLPAKLAGFILGIIRFADRFADGAISDSFKVLLIEMLSDEALVEASLQQFDPGFAEVIIGARNQVVVDDLRSMVEADEPPESVAIFYGAGHMADLADRLADQLGYRRTETRWLRAIEVDLTTSAVSEAEVRQLRGMIKNAMRQMNATQGGR